MKALPLTLSSRIGLERASWKDWMELTKARLTSFVLFPTAAGYYLALQEPVQALGLMALVFGVALLAGGAAALNQVFERDVDALMLRTARRPIPAGRISVPTAFWFGIGSSLIGLLLIALMAGWEASLIGALTLFLYVAIYTPLKRLTVWNTVVGAVPGALPFLIGWSGGGGSMTGLGWALFAILFFWQIPHFLAIAWIYREDYERAGFAMLPIRDMTGRETGQASVLGAAFLLLCSLLPSATGLTGLYYTGCALVLGVLFAASAVAFARRPSEDRARRMFYISLIYLPVLIAFMFFDKRSF